MAKTNGVAWFGTQSTQTSLAPSVVVSSQVYLWQVVLKQTIEVDDFFVVLRQMVEGGRVLVFASHRIREVLALSDRITVLRNGREIGTVVPGDVTRRDLAQVMVGHEIAQVGSPGRLGRPRFGSP